MERLPLSFRKMSGFALLMVIFGLLCLFHVSEKSRFSFLLTDIVPHDSYDIDTVYLTADFLDKNLDVDKLKTDSNYFPEKIQIQLEKTGVALLKNKNPRFEHQVKSQLISRFPELFRDNKLLGKKIYLFVNIKSNDIKKTPLPRLFYYVVYSPYELFVNGEMREKRVDATNAAFISTPLQLEKLSNRVVWEITNAYSDEIRGIHSRHGLSVVPEAYVNWAERFLRYQDILPNTIAAVFLFACAFFFFILALGNKEFSDLWASSVLCILLAATTWSETAYYWWQIDGYEINGRLGLIHLGLCLTFCATAITTLRMKNWSAWIPFVLAAIALSSIYMRLSPWYVDKSTVKSWDALSTLDGTLFRATAFIYLFILLVGVKNQIQDHRRFISEGLKPFSHRMWQRYFETFIIQISFISLVYVYGKGLVSRSTSTGIDIFLLFGIVPAAALLWFYHRMIANDANFRKSFSPQLNLIDHWLYTFGSKATKDSFHALLVVYDLVGYKAIDEIRSKGVVHALKIDKFISKIEDDILQVRNSSWIHLRYKSNADEFIHLFYAKDADSSYKMANYFLKSWSEKSKYLLSNWRALFEKEFCLLLEKEEILKIVERLDIHLMMSTCSDVKISVLGNPSSPKTRPDFFTSRYSQLSSIFKESRHDRIAMYRDDYERLIELPDIKASFSPLKSKASQDMGLAFLDLSRAFQTVRVPLLQTCSEPINKRTS